jgi:hypothetical protein
MVKNMTPVTICKILIGPNLVANTFGIKVKAFAEANNGHPNALQDPYEIADCKTSLIPNGYKGAY